MGNIIYMCKENRVYLNVKPEAMFAELHRMGMPDESHPGYIRNFLLISLQNAVLFAILSKKTCVFAIFCVSLPSIYL